jgi:hypothetical protein
MQCSKKDSLNHLVNDRTDEQPTPTQQATEITLQRRIKNALKYLEIFNAHAFKMDEQGTDPELEPRIENALKDSESATTRAFKSGSGAPKRARAQNWN